MFEYEFQKRGSTQLSGWGELLHVRLLIRRLAGWRVISSSLNLLLT